MQKEVLHNGNIGVVAYTILDETKDVVGRGRGYLSPYILFPERKPMTDDFDFMLIKHC